MSSTANTPLLRIVSLSKDFAVPVRPFKRVLLRAVQDVTLSVDRGRTLAIVGESGSGKTTLARLVSRLVEPTRGSVHLGDTELTSLSSRGLQLERGRFQMVFQDPSESVSPWQTVGQTLREPLQLHLKLGRDEIEDRVVGILQRVGLQPEHRHRYPHELSGGQQQRVGIARAVITNPDLVILDEPTSSLDMSVQSQILQLLKSLQRELSLTYIFISHDLNVVRFLAHEVAVMYLGKVVEYGPAEAVFDQPVHPYTQALLTASPRPDPHRVLERPRLEGEQPSALTEIRGCPLYGRCPIGLPPCATMPQKLVKLPSGQSAACWRTAPPAELDPTLRQLVIAGEGASDGQPPTPAAQDRVP